MCPEPPPDCAGAGVYGDTAGVCGGGWTSCEDVCVRGWMFLGNMCLCRCTVHAPPVVSSVLCGLVRSRVGTNPLLHGLHR